MIYLTMKSLQSKSTWSNLNRSNNTLSIDTRCDQSNFAFPILRCNFHVSQSTDMSQSFNHSYPIFVLIYLFSLRLIYFHLYYHI